MLERVGSYYYFFPEFNQGRRILWDGMDREGFKFLDHIPEVLRENTLNNEMKIILKNGSVFQVVGTDKYHSIRGTNPIGCVFSEYALQNPMAWDVVRPILAENNGWAIFNYTPLGKNHGWDIYDMAQGNNDWFCQLLTVDETEAISQKQIQDERDAGMGEDMIQQEFYCSFEASIKGAYYSDQVKSLREQNRICNVPYDASLPVHTAWDIGHRDATAIIFFQLYGKEIRIIDHIEESGEHIKYFISVLAEKKYKYGLHHVPHDFMSASFQTGRSTAQIAIESAKSHGMDFEYVVAPKLKSSETSSILEGIQAVRSVFPRMWIDKEKCGRLIECLSQYRKKYDEEKRIFSAHPEHDWTSHSADAMRYLAITFEDPYIDDRPKTTLHEYKRLTRSDPYENI